METQKRTSGAVPLVTGRMVVPLLLFGAAYVAVSLMGLPGLRASYDYVSMSARPTVDPLAPRYYTRCDYWAPWTGWFQVTPTIKGDCALIEWHRGIAFPSNARAAPKS